MRPSYRRGRYTITHAKVQLVSNSCMQETGFINIFSATQAQIVIRIKMY